MEGPDIRGRLLPSSLDILGPGRKIEGDGSCRQSSRRLRVVVGNRGSGMEVDALQSIGGAEAVLFTLGVEAWGTE